MILSPLGEENAKKLCDIEELKNIDSIYASDSYRAIGTAKYLAEKNNINLKLDESILGCNKVSELPDNFLQNSFNDKNLKFNNPDVFKIEFREKEVVNIENIEVILQ